MLLCGDILEVCLKYLIKKLTVTQSSIHQTHRFDCCFYDYFIITLPKNILIENILDAFFLHIEFGNKLITALQRSLNAMLIRATTGSTPCSCNPAKLTPVDSRNS